MCKCYKIFITFPCCCCCSLAKSCLTLWPHGLQHTRLPCPSLSLDVCSNSCPLSRWCHPTILYSVASFSSCLQFFPVSGPFSVSQFFASGGQSIGASAPVFPMNIQGWFPQGLTGPLLLVQGTLKSLLYHHNSKVSILVFSVYFMVQLSHNWLLEKW